MLSSEHAEGGWVKPLHALSRWEAGTALLHPPNLHALEMLAKPPPDRAALLEKLRTPMYAPGHVATRIEFQQGIRLFPLETATLPPATRNTGGASPPSHERLVVVISFCAPAGRDSIRALRRRGSSSPKMSSMRYTGARPHSRCKSSPCPSLRARARVRCWPSLP